MEFSTFFLLFCIIILFGYSVFFLSSAIVYSCDRKKSKRKFSNSTFFSVVIPVRNEHKRISNCLNSIISQDYPFSNYEVIVVDDHSEDNTLSLVKEFISLNSGINIRLISLTANNFGKKMALNEAIKNSKNEYIITRDADTISGPYWLNAISAVCESEHPDLLIAPVSLATKNDFLGIFQKIEFAVLQSSGGGMALMGFPYLCNGANLIFKKNSFSEVSGYEGNFHKASGDDIFLLEKFRKTKGYKLKFMSDSESEVITYAFDKLKDVLLQKSRWIGKFNLFSNPINTLSAFLLFFTNLFILLCSVITLCENGSIYGFYNLIFIKLIIDTLVLSLSGSKINFKILMVLFVIPVILPLYIIVVFLYGIFITPGWKGR